MNGQRRLDLATADVDELFQAQALLRRLLGRLRDQGASAELVEETRRELVDVESELSWRAEGVA